MFFLRSWLIFFLLAIIPCYHFSCFQASLLVLKTYQLASYQKKKKRTACIFKATVLCHSLLFFIIWKFLSAEWDSLNLSPAKIKLRAFFLVGLSFITMHMTSNRDFRKSQTLGIFSNISMINFAIIESRSHAVKKFVLQSWSCWRLTYLLLEQPRFNLWNYFSCMDCSLNCYITIHFRKWSKVCNQ